MFEAGALSKKLDASKLCPILFDIENTDLQGPLTQFQTTIFAREEIYKLVEALNAGLADRKLTPPVLEKAFDVWWPQLQGGVGTVLAEKLPVKKGSLRSERDLLEEVLTLTRHLSSDTRRTTNDIQETALIDLVSTVQELIVQLEQVEMPERHKILLQRVRRPLEYLDESVNRKRRLRPPLPPAYRTIDANGNRHLVPRLGATRIVNPDGTVYIMDKDGQAFIEAQPPVPITLPSDTKPELIKTPSLDQD